MRIPKWLSIERASQVLLVIGAAMNINIVVQDHAAWLNAGLAGMSIAWLMALSLVFLQSRLLARQRAALEELSGQMHELLEMKSQEIGEAVYASFHGEVVKPPVTKH